jgi:hypothetical protein
MSHVLSVLDQVDEQGLVRTADIDLDDFDPDEDDIQFLITDSRVVGERWLQSLKRLTGIRKIIPKGILAADKSPNDMATAALAAHKKNKTAAIRYMQFVLNRQRRAMDPQHRARILQAIQILQGMG